jgi:AcrR family transcriptional regulator
MAYSKAPPYVLACRMSRKRLTREDSRDQTTQRLLDAAQKLIAKKGLSAASVEDIAEAAGYTRGAFYSNFSSKGDLFIELLRRDHEKTHADLEALRNDELSVDYIQTRTRDLYGQIYVNNESFMNWTEARMLAARDAKFRTKLNALLAEKRGEIAEFISYFYKRVGIEAPVPPEAMAMGFMALIEGMKLSMLTSPSDVPDGTAESVLTLFIDSIMQMARLQGTKSRSDPGPRS